MTGYMVAWFLGGLLSPVVTEFIEASLHVLYK